MRHAAEGGKGEMHIDTAVESLPADDDEDGWHLHWLNRKFTDLRLDLTPILRPAEVVLLRAQSAVREGMQRTVNAGDFSAAVAPAGSGLS